MTSEQQIWFNTENFKTVYGLVFDADGNIKTCGRERCKDLIVASEKVEQGFYGDKETGIMNAVAIKKLYQKVINAK